MTAALACAAIACLLAWLWHRRQPPLTPAELAVLRAVAGDDAVRLDARAFLRAVDSLYRRGLIRRCHPGAFELTRAGQRALARTQAPR
jgi:hypothetical protein